MILRRSGWWMTGSGCSILHLAEQHPARISAPPPRWLRVSTAAMSRSAPVASSGESVTDLSILQSESNLWHRVLYVKPKRFPLSLAALGAVGLALSNRRGACPGCRANRVRARCDRIQDRRRGRRHRGWSVSVDATRFRRRRKSPSRRVPPKRILPMTAPRLVLASDPASARDAPPGRPRPGLPATAPTFDRGPGGTRDHSRRHAMACDAMLPQQVTYGVDGPRGVLTSGFVFGVATHFAVLGKPRRTVVS